MILSRLTLDGSFIHFRVLVTILSILMIIQSGYMCGKLIFFLKNESNPSVPKFSLAIEYGILLFSLLIGGFAGIYGSFQQVSISAIRICIYTWMIHILNHVFLCTIFIYHILMNGITKSYRNAFLYILILMIFEICIIMFLQEYVKAVKNDTNKSYYNDNDYILLQDPDNDVVSQLNEKSITSPTSYDSLLAVPCHSHSPKNDV